MKRLQPYATIWLRDVNKIDFLLYSSNFKKIEELDYETPQFLVNMYLFSEP